ncbi:MAG: DNA mismatch repair endonuclease MutL [Thermoanaerobaculales bacterium]|jgi:DNA mismatch repair protein MutL|nr:DNA mismatch repair endonuclease MutL [Thermoanaerobaculales bacterium]
MAGIRILPDALVNRIAAGEVVERPSSVVKELVENSLDAGAGRIEVELVNGGRSLIRVSDDGCGMSPDDALIALERHATSKIASAEDLDRLATLGFRGEALPSIAAVSRFEIVTSADPAEGGVRVTVEGGRVLGTEAMARARGTTVVIRDLFFNTPARRKFLHAPETELRHAVDAVWGAALARPDVAFALTHGSRTLVDAPPASNVPQRLRDLWSKADKVTRFSAASGDAEVEGLIATGSGRSRPALTLLVNDRVVKDRLVVGAVLRVLRETGGGFLGSRVVIDLRLPPDQVDVNVHPAKTEVRFARGGAVFALIQRAVREGVAASQGRVAVHRMEDPDGGVSEPPAGGYGELLRSRQRESAPPLFAHPAYGERPLEYTEPVLTDGGSAPRSGAKAGPADTPFGRLIGQYRESFILLEDDYGLAIVDQHVAHERVLYDRIRSRLGGETAPSQRLLAPVLVEVGEASAAAVDRIADTLLKVGVEVDVFGPDTVRLSALPPELDPDEAGELVVQVLDRATALDGVPEEVADAVEEGLAADLSCRGAVKVNHRLSNVEQRALLDDLAGTSNPYRCPHGRPIILRLSQEEMERRLGRR